LIGKAIKSKIYTNVYIITEINENDISSGNTSWSYDYLLKEYVFLDGSPCGKLVE